MILDEIVARKQKDLVRQKQELPQVVLEKMVAALPPAQDLSVALRRRGDELRLIAEIKRASPSKGPLNLELEPASLASSYVEHGAAAISVLTEERFFLGSGRDLQMVREALDRGTGDDGVRIRKRSSPDDRRVAILRKDFIFDPYQVYEARAWGADALLLIVAILSQQDLKALLELATSLGLSTLVETHDEREVEVALAVDARVIGINNRDLRAFTTDLATTERLRPLIPSDRVVVSESGIKTAADAQRLRRCGVDAILVGESLVTSGDLGQQIRSLIG